MLIQRDKSTPAFELGFFLRRPICMPWPHIHDFFVMN
jgi:hypothetical protein